MLPTESVISNKADESATEANVREAGAEAPANRDPAETLGARWRKVIGVLVCLEVGVFLLVAPWSALWTGNLLLEYDAGLRPFLMNPFLRGAISGVGLLNLWFAFHGVWEFREVQSAAELE